MGNYAVKALALSVPASQAKRRVLSEEFLHSLRMQHVASRGICFE